MVPQMKPIETARAATRSRTGQRAVPCRRGFTLIELLVVVAIIALLISILLPNLGRAREQARAAVCGQRLRDFATGLSIYTTENQDWIPGMNTTGFGVRANEAMFASDPGLFHRPKMPVQTTDWMTPVLSAGQELPALRAERFKFIFDKYRCPSQRYTSVPFVTGAVPPDFPDFAKQSPWPAASYKMSAWFQYVGQRSVRTLGRRGHPNPNVNIMLSSVPAPSNWEMTVDHYEPRITSVGPPARKVFISDGTRYLPSGNDPLDHEVVVAPTFTGGTLGYGAFSESGAWWSGSTSFGVKQGSASWGGTTVPRGSASEGANLPLSYRHGGVVDSARTAKDNRGQIDAVFFDGHVERLGDRESREAQFWYPSGARVNNASIAEGMTPVPQDFVVP